MTSSKLSKYKRNFLQKKRKIQVRWGCELTCDFWGYFKASQFAPEKLPKPNKGRRIVSQPGELRGTNWSQRIHQNHSVGRCWGYDQPQITLPKFKSSPLKRWGLEDEPFNFPIGFFSSLFQGRLLLNFGRGIPLNVFPGGLGWFSRHRPRRRETRLLRPKKTGRHGTFQKIEVWKMIFRIQLGD